MYRIRFSAIVGFVLLVMVLSGFTVFRNAGGPAAGVVPPEGYDEFIKEWSEIDSLVNIGLPKSALERTTVIYQEARQTNNHPQFIKAILYSIRLQSDFEEEFLESAVEDLEQEIAEAQQPASQLLHSILAEVYWRYFQVNRHKFYDRTFPVGIDQKDIRTWDLKTLMHVIIRHYSLSLDNPALLKNTDLKDYNAILETADKSKVFRPTLFDFLGHRALDFMMHDEASIAMPSNRFELQDETDFAGPSGFVLNSYASLDSLALKYYAIELFQELTRFHLSDDDPTALADLNLKRLDFVLRNSILQVKDSLYLQSLLAFEQEIINFPASTEVAYTIASEYQQKSNRYDPLVSDRHQWEVKKALETCEAAMARFPASPGAEKCAGLRDRIRAASFNLTLEKENLPGQPLLSLLRYKNLEQLHLRIVPIDYSEHRNMLRETRQRQDLIEKLTALTAEAEWVQGLPNTGDYQFHNVEIELPALQPGHYLLLGSDSPAFTPDTNTISYQSFWVTRIGFISQNSSTGGYKFYMLDREKGTALSEVAAKLFYRTYDYTSRTYQFAEGGEFLSDEDGYFEIPPLDVKLKPNSFFLEFRMKGDHFITSDRFYHSGSTIRKEKTRVKTHLFTDRSIYRPGQTVYFKGIVLESAGEKLDIKTAYPATVEFLDVNYQRLTLLELETNEYGSFQGSFIIPQGLLNGTMTLKTATGSATVQVEEYKRPNFEVAFNPIEGSYKVNQVVHLTGTAKAFAGNEVEGAAVRYRVVRDVYYPWRFGYSRFLPVQASMEITNGITQTDSSGSFTISFEALPDYSVPANFRPAFRYAVYVDVTDINNETQSANTSVSVGYQALAIDLDVGEVEQVGKFSKIPFRTTNLNGQAVSAKGSIEVALLREPEYLLREQLWQQPDLFVLDEAAFRKNFPHDSYSNENEPESLQEKSMVFSRQFDTETDSLFIPEDIGQWVPGRYRIKITTTDEYGTPVELVKYFILFSPVAKSAPVNELNWFYVLRQQCEPGESASFLIGTADRKVRVLYEVVHKEKVLASEWLVLNKEQRLIEIPVTEEFRGGFKVNLLFVKHNRVFKNNFGVQVPYTNKALDFEFITFRDKLKPGDSEEWKIRISGQKGDQVAAELLAGMYDASLDKFMPHRWNFNILSYPFHGRSWNTENAFQTTSNSQTYTNLTFRPGPAAQLYDQLSWFGFNYYGMYSYFRGGRDDMQVMEAMPGKAVQSVALETGETMAVDDGIETGESGLDEEQAAAEPGSEEAGSGSASVPQVRRDFRETAFFYPQLETNELGDVVIGFHVPESLTRWKVMGLGHTKDLSFGAFEKEVVTRKELMVVPNPPRFLRQGDTLEFSAKLVNLSDDPVSGKVELRFFQTTSMIDITSEVLADTTLSLFDLEPGKTKPMQWHFLVPAGYDMISYRLMAHGGQHSDGEEKPMPVLTNRMLVTESLPLPLNSNQTKTFRFEKLLNSAKNATLRNHLLTLEFSSNPAWYAVQALPYVLEGRHESADNVFNRFYANAIAAHIVAANPRIRQVFESWKSHSSESLLSNLDKNPELKSLVMQETPWVRDAQSEAERKQRIALLFDLNKMADEQALALRKLAQKQSPGGGWAWYDGMPDNRNITQQIVSGFGHLKQLGVFDPVNDKLVLQVVTKAIRYLDGMIKEDHDWLLEHGSDLGKNHLGNIQVQYLYARSFFIEEISISKASEAAFAYYSGQAKTYWNKSGIYPKAMIALTLHRLDESETARKIMASLKEYALYSEEMGMYWRDNSGGYYWYEAPVETQAMLIEAFGEVTKDSRSVEQMKTWLLKQKQTQDWKTARATAEAIYALLLRGEDWLESVALAKIQIGDQVLDPIQMEDTRVEAGTGYYKTSWQGKEISPSMGNVTVTNENPHIAWGALYWQYFEDLDKITFAQTPLKLDKQLYVKRNSDAGPVLEPLGASGIKTGDVVIVRIELRVDRDLEYVHMKDMRASSFEPVNVLSGYRYQGGLGYYETTRDASTDFFFDYLRKGTYVFEYPLVAAQKGSFSNGITSIQCLYAPEFTSHSEGVRVVVE